MNFNKPAVAAYEMLSTYPGYLQENQRIHFWSSSTTVTLNEGHGHLNSYHAVDD